MQASITRLFALGALVALTSVAASAQSTDERLANGTEAVGQSTSPQAMTSTMSAADVQAGAMAAARPSGTEAVGQSTGAPTLGSAASSESVYRDAVAASHASGTEALGQSTALPMGSGS